MTNSAPCRLVQETAERHADRAVRLQVCLETLGVEEETLEGLNLLLCKPLPKPHFAWLYQGRLVHRRQKQLHQRDPEDIVQGDQFRRLYRRLLGAVTQTDPEANRRTGGPEAQLRASMEHLHLNTLDDEEEEEELGGAEGLVQGSDRPRVSVRTRFRTKDRKDRSRNPELWRKQEREGAEFQGWGQ
ncbi:unnamed protein product [Boreogadus saida]